MRAHTAGILVLLPLLGCAAERSSRVPFEEDVRIEQASPLGEDPYSLYLLGRQSEEEGRDEEAIAAYGRVVEIDSFAVDVLTRLAELHLERREFEPAIRRARRAVDLDPGREDALMALGRSYLEGGRGDEALEHFQKLASEKEDATVRYLLSVLRHARGEPDAALRELERAVELAPERAFYRLRLGDAYHRRQDFEHAETAYKKAIELAQNDGPVKSALARMYGDAGRWEEAAAAYEELVATGHRPRDTHERLVSIYLRLRKGEDALRHAEALRELDPADRELRAEIADLHVMLGREEEGIAEFDALWKEDRMDLAPAKRIVEIRLAGERFAEAEPLLREMLAARPEESWCWTRLSYVLLRLGDSDGSLRALERAVAVDPADAGAAFLLGNEYLARGRLDDALGEFERAYASGLRTAELLGKKAATEAELERPDTAIETLRELLRLEPDNASALNHLGYLLSDLGRDLDEAERLVNRALGQRPENPFFRDSLGWVYHRKGDHEAAVRELRRAHEGRREDPVILEHLADALAAAGNVREAAEAYRAVLRLQPENASAARKLREIAEP